MQLKLFLVLLTVINVHAQNLEEILDFLDKSEKARFIKERTYSTIAQNELSTSQEAPSISTSLSQAIERTHKGREYSISIGQTIQDPFSLAHKDMATKYLTSSMNQELKHELHILELDITSRYHSACISKEIRNKADLLFKQQSNKFNQLKESYVLGETSKKNFLFNKLDLLKLRQKVISQKRAYLEELSYLQETIDNLEIDDLSCNDLVKISRHIKLNEINEHGKIINISYLQASALAFSKVYDSALSSISYKLLFQKELDTKRYTFGLSIPISSLTSKKENQRALYLHKNTALIAQKELLKSEIFNISKSLQLKVETLYDEYTLLKEDILPLNFELKAISKSALNEGEGTIMQYLDSTRSYSENILEMLRIKKEYYFNLFELYKQADLDLGEK
ncbi:MAG: hypothetical protein COB17_05950 [Sulfurimonas sp.]|nr:MAG: hypothetical protein COB17_05950 [Sulfurimonas sp.]